MLKTQIYTTSINIDYFTYSLEDAQFFLCSLASVHPQNHLYVIKENMRYVIRGYVVYEGNDIKFERYQIAYLAEFCGCNNYNPEDDSTNANINFRMAG